MPPTTSALEEIAINTEHTVDDLRATAIAIERAYQPRFNVHYNNARLTSGRDYWLIEDPDGAWIAQNEYEIQDELSRADPDITDTINDDLVRPVALAYLTEFQASNYTLGIPGPVARTFDDPFFFPIQISYPNDWSQAIWHIFQQFKYWISRYNLSPTEAMDYWVVTQRNQQPADWAASRDVAPESVRKNVRQARSKLEAQDVDNAAQTKIRVVSKQDVPDGEPHDEDQDMFYIPFEDTTDSVFNTDPERVADDRSP